MTRRWYLKVDYDTPPGEVSVTRFWLDAGASIPAAIDDVASQLANRMTSTQTANHTPGPWTIEPGDDGDSSVGLAPTQPVVFTNIPNREDRYIEIAVVGSTVYDNSEDGHPAYYGDAEANARLIAAAPDLLAALKDALRLTDLQGQPRVVGIMQAAVAKAEGR